MAYVYGDNIWVLITHSIHQINQPTMRLLKEIIVFSVDLFSSDTANYCDTHIKFSDSCCVSVTHVLLSPCGSVMQHWG